MNIQNLSDLEVEQNLLNFAHQERKLLHLILLHIKEVDVRRLYLSKGCTSLFDYLVTALGYSAAAAQRRIEGARLIREIPEVAEKIRDGRLHLSHIGEVVRAVKQKEQESRSLVKPATKLALVESVERKTISETQKLLSASLDLALRPRETKTVQKDESVYFQLTFSKEQMQRYSQCRNLASHKLLKKGGAGFSEVFDHLMKYYLKYEGGISTSEAEAASRAHPSAGVHEKEKAGKSVREKAIGARGLQANKTVTPKTRRLIRSKYACCQHKDPIGVPCESQFLLEVDHRVPKWAGGGNELTNLTLLCANHNRAKYRKEAGIK